MSEILIINSINLINIKMNSSQFLDVISLQEPEFTREQFEKEFTGKDTSCHKKIVTALKFSPSTGAYLATGSSDGQIKVTNLLKHN